MKVANTIVSITGTSRGIGQALVNEALKRGTEKVYVGPRSELHQ
jgi:NAD(P)-dependent dehydrogenase (short-subunit alcohol dehydrogenase family)